MLEFEIKKFTDIPRKHIGPKLLLGRRPSDKKKVREILPGGVDVVAGRIVAFADGITYHTIIGTTPGTEGNWAVNVSAKTFKSLISR